MLRPLHLAADWSRLVLALGLVAGVLLPGLAGQMSAHLPIWIAGMMFAGALRLSPDDLAGMRRGLGSALTLTAVLQVVCPSLIALLLVVMGWTGQPFGLVILLLAAAPPIIGSANIAALLGLDSARAMQLMLVGTLALPLTVLPVLWVLPGLGSTNAVLGAVFRLLLLVGLAGGGAVVCRALFLPRPDAAQAKALDGLSVVALAVVVIALMPAVSRSAVDTPGQFLVWLILAFALNLGTQLLTRPLFRTPPQNPAAFTTGNRNLGIFFAALPAATTDPLLVFLGCYQMPMFLSPLLMRWLYTRN